MNKKLQYEESDRSLQLTMGANLLSSGEDGARTGSVAVGTDSSGHFDKG